MRHPVQNPALKNLDVLVGVWSVEISNMSFQSDPSATVRGQDRFEWLEGGAFLMMYSDTEYPDVPNAVRAIGRDDSVEKYSMLYFDSRGVSRIYDMSLEDGVWKLWRNAPGFRQRFTGTFSADGNTIAARWEKSSDGTNWEHDFDLTYQKIR
ncbi:MAG: hypothetical protein ACJ78Q_16035 [Chloroflexia bacterium]